MCPEKCLFQSIRPQSKRAQFSRLNAACTFSENGVDSPLFNVVLKLVIIKYTNGSKFK
jgi:hypothetical protein